MMTTINSKTAGYATVLKFSTYELVEKFNPNHVAPGVPTGGQFTSIMQGKTNAKGEPVLGEDGSQVMELKPAWMLRFSKGSYAAHASTMRAFEGMTKNQIMAKASSSPRGKMMKQVLDDVCASAGSKNIRASHFVGLQGNSGCFVLHQAKDGERSPETLAQLQKPGGVSAEAARGLRAGLMSDNPHIVTFESNLGKGGESGKHIGNAASMPSQLIRFQFEAKQFKSYEDVAASLKGFGISNHVISKHENGDWNVHLPKDRKSDKTTYAQREWSQAHKPIDNEFMNGSVTVHSREDAFKSLNQFAEHNPDHPETKEWVKAQKELQSRLTKG